MQIFFKDMKKKRCITCYEEKDKSDFKNERKKDKV